MINRPLCLDDFTESLASVSEQKNYEYGTNKGKNIKMANILIRAINGELTQKQQECIFRYYEKNMRIVDIAKELKVCPSTVSRHLSKARNRLKVVIGYYFNDMN